MRIFYYCIQELHSSWIFALNVHVVFLVFGSFVYSFASQAEVSGWKTKYFSSKRLSICTYICVYVCVYMFLDGVQIIS